MIFGRLCGSQELARAFVVEEITSVLRHGLRNKIAAIRNANHYLRRKVGAVAAGDERVAAMFEVVSSETAAMDGLLASKLSPATMEEDGPTCDLSRLVATLIDAAAAGELLRVMPPEAQGPVRARGRAEEIGLALACLLDNALEAVAQGGSRVAVRIGRRAADAVAVEIVDDGPGLPAGGASQAFEPFFTTKRGRLGMGLNMAKRVAGRSGGAVVLSGAQGRGLCASLILRAVAGEPA